MTEQNYLTLFHEARAIAEATPQIGSKLAGNCTSVSYSMLGRVREFFGTDIRLCVGWIEYKGEKKWDFTDADVARWKSGIVKPTNMVHCWLQSDSHLLDLTLSSTLYEIEQIEKMEIIPSDITYIDREIAEQLDIKHVEKLSGDQILFDLNF